MKNKRILGTLLITSMFILAGLSLAMIASVSFPKGQKEYNNSYYFVIRQLIWLVMGTFAFIGVSNFKYTRYKKISAFLYFAGFFLLVLVLVIGKEVNGAKRWLSVGFFSIQPSEFAKIILILVLATVINSKRKNKKKIKMMFNIMMLVTIFGFLILVEKSFSNTAQLGIIGLIMLFMSGVSLKSFGIALSGLLAIASVAVLKTPYRMKRIIGFTGSSETVYQEKQSLIAIGSGGLLGKFYGNGLQKYFYLPEIHTDYIFAGYAEEMGFVGAILLIIVYIVILGVIFVTITKIKDMYAKYILIGIFGMFATQIAGNMAVVLGIAPSTGIPLPIMSYGGSTTIVAMISLGIVYNIIKELYIQEAMDEENNK